MFNVNGRAENIVGRDINKPEVYQNTSVIKKTLAWKLSGCNMKYIKSIYLVTRKRVEYEIITLVYL
jgi:hypothetical protein